jgi:hypothetical protein
VPTNEAAPAGWATPTGGVMPAGRSGVDRERQRRLEGRRRQGGVAPTGTHSLTLDSVPLNGEEFFYSCSVLREGK